MFRYSKFMIYLLLILNASLAGNPIKELAKANGVEASNEAIEAIAFAAKAYGLNPKELAAIAILESSMGNNARVRVNTNGTIDVGLFQINSVNVSKCTEYNITTFKGSALCAAKLLNGIKRKHSDYIGRYHSKTPSKKTSYQSKVSKILMIAAQ